jgi:hypothetical protein
MLLVTFGASLELCELTLSNGTIVTLTHK